MRMHSASGRVRLLVLALGAACGCCLSGAQAAQAPLTERLRHTPFSLAYECYVDHNWEIFTCEADGSHPANLTRTPAEHEHYPQISPDGRHLAFVADRGEGRDTIRSVYVMNQDGTQRRKIADDAREPFWSPDGKALGFLHQEYPKFSVMDYYTRGMSFYELATGQIRPHPNSANLRHLYNPCFARNGKWIAATVHGGMGYSHAIVLIEAQGSRVVDLQVPGCRPNLSPDNQHLAWSAGEHELAVAPLDLNAPTPNVGPWQLRIKDDVQRLLHAAWSPDGHWLSFSRGPDGQGDPTKPGTFQAAAGMVGAYAPGWNIAVVWAASTGTLDLNQASGAQFGMITTNGLSNKEAAWFRRSE